MIVCLEPALKKNLFHNFRLFFLIVFVSGILIGSAFDV